jgi:NAD(P)-dependent dehydrogenase (short-subunit alcohol dehydrogenase family)
MKKISELINLSNRKALVSGGAGYIGRATAETLVELGAQVAILDVDLAKCTLVSDELGNGCFPVACDLRDEVKTREAVLQVVDQIGGLDILVHCAAFVGTTEVSGWAISFEKQSVDAWNMAVQVNLTSAFVMAQTAFPALSASLNGSIILFSSIYGMVAPDMRLYDDTKMANPAGYNATKGGILQLTRYLSTVLAPNVRVNSISPGGVFRNQPEIFVDRYKSRTPLQRMATEEDLKGAIAYLASDMSCYVTGHNLVVDGGWTVW